MWRFRRRLRGESGPGVLVDCGANVGDVTGLFLEKGFTVHAFEPDARARAELVRRHGGNPRLTVYEQAVGANSRRQVFHQATSDNIGATQASSLIHQAEERHDFATEVEVIDLFAFIASLNSPPDVLKLDIEGAEVEILERMLDEDLLRDVEAIYVETHERISEDIARRTAAIRRRVAAMGRHHIDLDWQ